MIYTFGCSATKWHWPTWADWLEVYAGPVTNCGYKGYSNDNIYWTLLEKILGISPNDHVIIMWTQNHRMSTWYDEDWINEKDVKGFFPNTNGKLWFTESQDYRGMYRTHPDYQPSLTQFVVNQFQTIYNTQLLLEKHNCNYTMLFFHNPFLDCRPKYLPDFQIVWDKKTTTGITKEEIDFAKHVLSLKPIKKLFDLINWDKFETAPNDRFEPTDYSGIVEYAINKKYLLYSHDNDPHPVALASHDFALEKILKVDPRFGQHRNTAIDISRQAMTIEIPKFTEYDYVADPTDKLLDSQFYNILNKHKEHTHGHGASGDIFSR